MRWATFVAALLLAVAGCGKSSGGGRVVGSGGGSGQVSAACVDRPGSLMTPPLGRLPCELIPPGLNL